MATRVAGFTLSWLLLGVGFSRWSGHLVLFHQALDLLSKKRRSRRSNVRTGPRMNLPIACHGGSIRGSSASQFRHRRRDDLDGLSLGENFQDRQRLLRRGPLGMSVGWNASAISGEYLSAASFMGIAGMVMSSGYDALWYPVCYACGYLFLLLFIAGPLRRFGAYTIPDFAEGRFDSPLFRKIAVCFVLFIGFFYTMPQMKGAGTTLAYIFPGLPYWAGVVLVGAVITLNVALGGMKGITLVQAFQYWAKMFAISVPIFVLMAVYFYNAHLKANRRDNLATAM
jgi:hypothetical protein